MKRDELLARVRASHEKLTAAIDGLTDEAAGRVGVNAQWSVKDALAHITAWELEGAETIRQLQAGTYERKSFNQETVDRFNAEAVESRRGLTIEQARSEFEEAHAAFVRVLETLPEEVEERSPFYKVAEGVAINHHAQHAAQIEEWKKKISTQ